ncbi:MAG: formylglycine-generating enzyme family protein [Mariprofundaceae bacterium]
MLFPSLAISGQNVASLNGPRHGDVMDEPLVNMGFVYIKPGSFVMGSPESEADRFDDERQHDVRIEHGFWIGKFEVTFAQYDAFCKAARHTRARDSGWGRGDQPVINITWHEAVTFANWLSKQTGHHYRLPTEAEWEYAARAGTTTAYSFGDSSANYADYAWSSLNSDRKAHPVGQKRPNPWGLYDMHGNVWEWTASKYAKGYDGSERKAEGFKSFARRAVRGGSWYFLPRGMRSADRRIYSPKQRLSFIGFRLVREQ